MSLEKNPAVDRLKFIAKTYAKQPWIVLDAIDVIARTVGEDRWRERVWEGARADLQLFNDIIKTQALEGSQVEYHKYELLGQREWPENYEAVAQAIAVMAGELDGFKVANPADGAFPWMATQLSRLAKAAGRFTRMDDGARAAFRDYQDAFVFFRRSGTAIGQWMRRERPDLTRMSWTDVEEALEDFEVSTDNKLRGPAVYNWEDGWTIQKLVTDEQLESEGERMQHCVGSYCDQVREGDAEIYSLRDDKNRSHVTIEYDPKKKKVVQIKGKQNAHPKPEYQERVDEFLEEGGLDLSGRTPKHLLPILKALGLDADDEESEHDAEAWHEAVGSDAVEWISVAGMMQTEYRLAEHLVVEGVTPEMYKKFPDVIRYKLQAEGDWFKGFDTIVSIAKIVAILSDLSAKHPRSKSTSQLDLFASSEEDRVAQTRTALLQLGFNKWDFSKSSYGASLEGDELLIPEAKAWNDAEFFDEDTIEPWWVAGFSPGEAREWADQQVDPETAIKLRDAGLDWEDLESTARQHPQLNWRLRETQRFVKPTDEDLDDLIAQALRDREEDERLRRNRRR